MTIAGLTGGFGTGKSYVASIFRKLGAHVVDADRLAHGALKKGTATYKKVVASFGKSILDPDGSINRKALAKIVFGNKKCVARLNRIIHPYVMDIIRLEIRKNKEKILIVDAPLIYETELVKLMDILIVVKASRHNQINRCVKKFNIKSRDVYRRMACQMPLKEKIKIADYVIDNNGAKSRTRKEVVQLWRKLKKGAD